MLLPAVSPAPVPVGDDAVAATYPWLKYWSPSITPMTTANRITGLIVGSVTYQSRRRAPAPSSSADSYRCLGTSSSAAMKMIIVLPTPHSPSSTSDGFDQDGSWNQSGPWMPIFDSTVFTGP